MDQCQKGSQHILINAVFIRLLIKFLVAESTAVVELRGCDRRAEWLWKVDFVSS
jgi:hypothetical protein